MDGNAAAAHVAYHMSEAAFLFPITPSSPMGEAYDSWACKGKKNIWGRVPEVRVLQSEAGASGALHGAASVGTFTTTFTASQGLLLMIPNMLKTAGELWPTVFHVAARAVSTQALSIQGDHSDIMCCKNSGFAFLSSSNVQQCMDMAAIAHMSTVDSEIPFVHFFEGFRLSHQIDAVTPLTPEEMKSLMPFEKLEKIRQRALNPTHPMILGHSQGPDAYFQTVELGNQYYNRIPKIVQDNMDKFAKLTGRQYHLFDFYGDKDAEDVIVMMGAGAPVVREAMSYMRPAGHKLGLIVPHLYRPWSMEDFVKALPKTVKRISVLDRSKDPAAEGEPLFMDVGFTLKRMGHPAKVFGGRYGLANRDFTPPHVKAIYDNMRSEKPKERFTIGIKDDVTHLSLPATTLDGFIGAKGTRRCVFWGLGGDGTIGANKAAIKAVINAGQNAQGYFSYSADKSNSLTRSYLRFSDKEIHSQYNIIEADFIGCTLPAYVQQYPMVDKLKQGGTFFLNFPWGEPADLEKHLPAKIKRLLAQKKAQFYVIDASTIAENCGLRGKISTIIQACFFKLSGILGSDFLPVTLKWVETEFSRLGEDVVRKNKKAATEAIKHLKKIEIPENWIKAQDPPGKFASKSEISFFSIPTHEISAYKKNVLEPTFAMSGGALPVSAYKPSIGGVSPMATTRWLKKGLATHAPVWKAETCIQCNACSAICPHSCIRPFLLKEEEIARAPEQIKPLLHTIPANGKELSGLQFRIQCSPYDCLGCELCYSICPTKSIEMVRTAGSEQGIKDCRAQNDIFIYLTDCIPNRGSLSDKFTLRGSQFQMPYIEFPGSCAGCNETLATKIVTQLFGPRMVIANASGCSSVWGGAFPRIPFTTDKDGRGPAWARSLFEDNAEFGYGMAVGLDLRRRHLKEDVDKLLSDRTNIRAFPPSLITLLTQWSENFMNGEETYKLYKPLLAELDAHKNHPAIKAILDKKDLIVKQSNWILGGDGWAYDIGYGGLDHIFAQKRDFNVLVFDNELYANTGGQQSKSTQCGAVAQFAANGKREMKKDLGYMMMSYDNVYVASCSLGSQKDLKHFIKCCKEAESFPGPSLILVYCNCILHHIKGAIQAGGEASLKAHRLAVEGGYWPVYSYDPRREKEGKNPFEMLSKKPDLKKLDQFLDMEVRFNGLKRQNPQISAELREQLHRDVMRRYSRYVAFGKGFEKQ